MFVCLSVRLSNFSSVFISTFIIIQKEQEEFINKYFKYFIFFYLILLFLFMRCRKVSGIEKRVEKKKTIKKFVMSLEFSAIATKYLLFFYFYS